MGLVRSLVRALAYDASTTQSSAPAATAETLPLSKTNGNSLLGTLDAPTYPKFLCDNPSSTEAPWGDRTVWNTNPYHDSPDTGVTRYYDWTVANHILYPDGYEKDMIVVNGEFPGPVIEANWGDMISVTVRNNITGEAPQETSIHWHGFLQHNSQWADGSPGLTQCPIAPGDTFTYTFKAELYGSSWWHGHLSGQWANGLEGPVIVHGPSSLPYDIDIGPITVLDWFHPPAEEVQLSLLEPRDYMGPEASDNNLISGKNPYPCQQNRDPTKECLQGAPRAEFLFQPGKVHRLRLINSGAQAVQKFSIDNHMMTIIANDFVPVEPYNTSMVTLGVGQRTDVLVIADQDSSRSYWMRSVGTCAQTTHSEAKAMIVYAGGSSDMPEETLGMSTWLSAHQPFTGPQPDVSLGRNPGCGNDPLELTVPTYKMPVQVPDAVETFRMTLHQNTTGSWVWWMNNISYLSDFDNPSLLLLTQNNSSYIDSQPKRVPYYVPEGAKSYRFILDNKSPGPHPMHMHGHNMHVLYVSTYPWDESQMSIVDQLIVRPENPQRRDVQQVPAGGYLVIQIDADNPGSWGLHCHMAFHIGGGFFVDVVEGREKLVGAKLPDDVYRGCKNWYAFSRGEKYTDAWTIDSGQRV